MGARQLVVQEAAEMILIVRGKGLFVYAVNDGLKVVAGGSGNNNLLCACIDVSHGLFLGAVETGAFENNVNAELTPGQFSSIRFQRRW